MEIIAPSYTELKGVQFVSQEWVQEVYFRAFEDYIPFPDEYSACAETENVSEIFTDMQNSIIQWCNENEDIIEDLSQGNISEENNESYEICESLKNIDNKLIMTLLGSHVLRFLKYDSTNITYFSEAMSAANLYYTLIGSSLNKIFNFYCDDLYMLTLNLLIQTHDIIQGVKNFKQKSAVEPELSNTVEHDQSLIHTDDSTPQERRALILKELCKGVDGVEFFVHNNASLINENSMELTFKTLVFISQLERKYILSPIISDRYMQYTESYISSRSVEIMMKMCNDHSESIRDYLYMIFDELKYVFTIEKFPNSKETQIIRKSAMEIIKLILGNFKENSHEPFIWFVEYICSTSIDKADIRQKAVNDMLQIYKEIDSTKLQLYFIKAIIYMSHMNDWKIRALTLDILFKILDTNIPEGCNIANSKFIVAVVLYHCHSVSSNVQTKALSIFEQLLSSENQRIKSFLNEIFLNPYVDYENPKNAPGYRKELFDTRKYLLNELEENEDYVTGVGDILRTLLCLLKEDKAALRRVALITLAKIVLYNPKWITTKLLKGIAKSCSDHSLLIRKTMVTIVTELLMKYKDNKTLIAQWVQNVLPAITDKESKDLKKVPEILATIILDNLNNTSAEGLPWTVLDEVIKQDKESYLALAISKWILLNRYSANHERVIYKKIDNENNIECWLLLSCVARYKTLDDKNFVSNKCLSIIENSSYENEALPLIIQASYLSCLNWSDVNLKAIYNKLISDLLEFRIPISLVGPVFNLCGRITCIRGEIVEYTSENLVQLCEPLVKVAEEYIVHKLSCDVLTNEIDDEKLWKCLSLYGLVAGVVPKFISPDVIKLIKNILLTREERRKNDADERTNAIAVLTLSQYAIEDEEKAFELIPILSEIIKLDQDPTLLVNAIFGLCDMSVRFANLVKRKLPEICLCFLSYDENVRKLAVTAILRRLSEKYLQLSEHLLYPLLTMILDKSKEIVSCVEYFIRNDLKADTTNRIDRYFVGYLFFLNACEKHPLVSGIDRNVLSQFSCQSNEGKRFRLYHYWLDNISDAVSRQEINKRIVHDLMGIVVDKKVRLRRDVLDVLSDAIYVMCCNEKKIKEFLSHKVRVDNEDEEAEVDADAVNAKKTSMEYLEKKRLPDIKEALPILLKVKEMLRQTDTSVEKKLMAYLALIMKSFEEEVLNTLAISDTLTKELKFDIQLAMRECNKKHEKNKYKHISKKDVPKSSKTDSQKNETKEPVENNEAIIDDQQRDTNEVEEENSDKSSLLRSKGKERKRNLPTPEDGLENLSINDKGKQIEDEVNDENELDLPGTSTGIHYGQSHNFRFRLTDSSDESVIEETSKKLKATNSYIGKPLVKKKKVYPLGDSN